MVIIVSASDQGYLPHFAALLHSIRMHSPRSQLYLLDCGIDEDAQGRLTEFAASLGIALEICPVDIDQFSHLPVSKGLTAATYARFLMPTVLPHITRAIYIDCDCVVVGDLSPLWNIDLLESLVAGVPDDLGAGIEGVKAGTYINAGVLVIDLAAWRRERVMDTALEYMAANRSRLRFDDQTALNAIMRDRIAYLPREWNMMMIERRNTTSYHVPRIIHYNTHLRPWLYRDAPLAEIYRFHRRATPFPLAEDLPPVRPLHQRLLTLLTRRRRRQEEIARYLYWRRFTKPYLAAVASS